VPGHLQHLKRSNLGLEFESLLRPMTQAIAGHRALVCQVGIILVAPGDSWEGPEEQFI
jgi:hypothetical protein